MTRSAIIMMSVICSLVWGGFASLLVFVIRMEKKKRGRTNV